MKGRTLLIAHSVPEVTIICQQSVTFALNRITWSKHFWKVKVFHKEVCILGSFLLSCFPPAILGNGELVGILCLGNWSLNFLRELTQNLQISALNHFISPHVLPCPSKAAVWSLPYLDSVQAVKIVKGLLLKENRLQYVRKQLNMDKPFSFSSYNKCRLTETS